jgi:multidrug resistance efflux pump
MESGWFNILVTAAASLIGGGGVVKLAEMWRQSHREGVTSVRGDVSFVIKHYQLAIQAAEKAATAQQIAFEEKLAAQEKKIEKLEAALDKIEAEHAKVVLKLMQYELREQSAREKDGEICPP